MNTETESLDAEGEITIEKVDGRTKAGRATRGRTREATREGTRTPILGRNNEVLSRTRSGTADPFDIPADLIPAGWDYQWNVVSVTGNADVCLDQGMGMYENGWRPVPAERHPGRFVARGTKGEIIRGGQRLEERPLQLTLDAKAEDQRNARRLISDRNESLKLSSVSKAMPDGFEMNSRRRGTGGQIRMSIDPALDIDVPGHTLAGPGD